MHMVHVFENRIVVVLWTVTMSSVHISRLTTISLACPRWHLHTARDHPGPARPLLAALCYYLYIFAFELSGNVPMSAELSLLSRPLFSCR
jgi:hypothetical protein